MCKESESTCCEKEEEEALTDMEPRDTNEHEIDNFETLDDDFDKILSLIVVNEEEAMSFEIPASYNMDKMLDGLRMKKELTERQRNINKIIAGMDREKVSFFIKKLFFKFGKLLSNVKTKPNDSSIPEKEIVQFYGLVHQFSTSDEYKMYCLILFEGTDDNVSDCHMSICYDILESVRIFCIKEKVNLLTITGANIPQRQETNAAKARIRYVAGYCLSSLRKKLVNMRSGNIYSKTSEGQASYDYAKCALKLITALREDEHFLKINTSDPDSLADIESRQYSSGRLINVSDFFFKIMQKLTTSILSILIYDNLMKHGKDLMSHCLCKIMEQQEFYKEFVTGSVTSFRVSQVEEFSETESIKNLIDHMSLVSSIIADIYKLIVKKYIMVLLAQFRRDFKSYLNVEKTMAHRKQIKTTKKSTAKERTESSKTELKQKRKKKKAESELAI